MIIIKSSGPRNSALTPGSNDGVGDRGMGDRSQGWGDRGRSQQIRDQFRAKSHCPSSCPEPVFVGRLKWQRKL